MPSFNDLIAELKRRRVFRVAGPYLVGAWIVLQVADTPFPALRSPVKRLRRAPHGARV